MFSITLVNVDSYQASPIPEFDVTFSEFRGSEVKKVPVIRIFGSTPSGKKTCLHVHGVFPYMYVPCIVRENTDSFAYQLATSIDSALNMSFGSMSSTNQYVYKVQQVSGIPFYGYHEKEHLFFKIYFYNPAIIKRIANLLQSGAILNQHLQSYEAHIPYILQFMIDYNLYGMNLVNLSVVRYRHSLQGCTVEDSQNSMDLSGSQIYLPASVARQSMCKLEVDAHASDILNRQSVTKQMELNPGLAAIWEEERTRRMAAGLENVKSQLLYPKTFNKHILPPTSNDIHQQHQLLKRLNFTSQTNETERVVSSTSTFSYPAEIENDECVLNASHILDHDKFLMREENIEKNDNTVTDDNKLSQSFLRASNENQSTMETSILDAEDIQLMEMLVDLARENETTSNVDDDSILGSQYSVFSEPTKNVLEEEEEEEIDLNITSLDLDSLGFGETAHKETDQNVNLTEAVNDKNNCESSDNLDVTEQNCKDVALMNLSQVDGANDSFRSIEDEKEIINYLTNKSDATCCIAICNSFKNIKNNVSIMNVAKNNIQAVGNLHRNLRLIDIKYIVNSHNGYRVKRQLYNFVNRYYFHIFIKTRKNFRALDTYLNIDTNINRRMCHLQDNTKIITYNKKVKKESCVTRYQLDHQDLDVFDIDEIETFDIAEDISRYRVLNYEGSENIRKQAIFPKSCFQWRVFLNGDRYLQQKLYSVPNVDGATATDSSDSESDVDVTIYKQEKRACAYKRSSTKSMVQNTPKKTKIDFNDEHKTPGKQRKVDVRTPKRSCHSLNKIPKSPQCSSGSYSPLNITITSPKTDKSSIQPNKSPKRKQYIPSSSAIFASTTPKRKTRPLRVNLLHERCTQGDNIDTDQIHEQLMINKIDVLQTTSDISPLTTIAHKSIKNIEQRIENNECPLIEGNKRIRKKLYFFNHDDVKNTFAESIQHASQSENLIGLECLPEKTHVAVNIFSSSNESDEDNIPSSQYREKNNNTSPDRDYASNIHNLANKSTKFQNNIIPETPDINEDEDETCNTTFTQHINQKAKSDSQNLSLNKNIPQSQKNTLITITTKYKPPSLKRILESMISNGIPKCATDKLFFSNALDFIKQKESSNSNSLYFNIPVFKSNIEEITGIKLWRRMTVNEFYPSGSNIKTCHLKRTLAGYNLVTIKPLVESLSSKDVKNWLKAEKHLPEKDYNQITVKLQKDAQGIYGPSVSAINANSELQSTMPNQSQNVFNGTSNCHEKFNYAQNSDHVQHSQVSNNILNPSQEMVKNSLLYKDKTEQQLRVSYGQIECLSKSSCGNVSSENFQNVKIVTAHQNLTLLSLEVHVITREDLLPDPQYDSIVAIFYAIYNDVSVDASEQIKHDFSDNKATFFATTLGAIIISSCPVSTRLNKIHSASAMCPILYVTTELDMLNALIKLIEQHDPDILVGWEVETLSWGYIFQRASYLSFNGFPLRISKVPYVHVSSKSDAHFAFEKDDINKIVPGRNILDIWRIMRHEAALLIYTFENVMHHVLRERIPCPSFRTLSTWWRHESMTVKHKVIHHYVVRVIGTLKILIHLDIIGRTCEHARLFGIQLYEVFSRGSQFRVESMMLRLAKPFNYIPISPSIHQKANMRAPECLPLIMEPESKFYTDPLIVLDFQSLYPSMIIAYNYCFSTCLGRIEHIGQYEPFEFGAATLKVNRNTALKLKNKVNISPCGIVFVKREVRQGILPRMLSEILNTRLMIKESMKLYSMENRTLQRVLHSQQLGLKLIANVTYGYTSANFSGRMPCIEIGDSVVSKGRETLERAIKLVKSTSRWGARVVYGDTDSLFVLLPGKSRKEAFTIGEEIADAVTATNPPPVKLKFEKVLQPAILQTKKRYCGYMYETRDQEKPEFLAKGIEMVRRDGCPAVSKILEKTLKILFDTKDISLMKSYVTRQFDKIFRRCVSIQDLTFAKEFRGMHGYKANACVPALELTRRLMKKDPRAVPRTSERVRYIVVAGAPNQALIHCIRTPMEVINDPALIPNSVYYITKVIIPPLNRCLNLFEIDVNMWYKEMSHRQNFDNIARLEGDNPKTTICQFFSSVACIVCRKHTNGEVCPECLSQPSRTVFVLLQKISQLKRTHQQVAAICHSCIGRLDNTECISLDCPVLYRMTQAHKDLAQIPYINNIIYRNKFGGIKETNIVAEW